MHRIARSSEAEPTGMEIKQFIHNLMILTQ